MNFQGKLPGWRAHWGADALRARHAQIKDRAFAQGYRMQSYADSDFDLPNFRKALELGKDFKVPNPLPADWMTFMGVDLASSRSRRGNAIFVGAIDSYRMKYPLYMNKLKGSSPEVARAVGWAADTFKCSAIMVENNAYQQSFIDWANALPERFSYWQNIVPFHTGSNKADPTMGVSSMDVEFAAGGWIVPADLNPDLNGHGIACDCGPCTWTQEVQSYPHGSQIDTVMAMWFFREACRRYVQEQPEPNAEPEIVYVQDGRFSVLGDDEIVDLGAV